MKTNVFTVFISLMALISCRSPQQTVIPTEKIETKVERVIEVRWDTAYIEVPAQSAEITTPDSVSHLETDFATSDARINPDGTLSFTICLTSHRNALLWCLRLFNE